MFLPLTPEAHKRKGSTLQTPGSVPSSLAPCIRAIAPELYLTPWSPSLRSRPPSKPPLARGPLACVLLCDFYGDFSDYTAVKFYLYIMRAELFNGLDDVDMFLVNGAKSLLVQTLLNIA